MAATAPASAARKLLDERLSQLSSELEVLVDREIASQLSTARRETCESFNLALRRLRGAAGWSGVAAVLADTAAGFCGCAAVFRIAGNVLHGEAVRGIDKPEAFAGWSAPLAGAPALRSAVESGDPVFCAGAPEEVSPALVAQLLHAPTVRVGIFPITAGNVVTGLLYAVDGAQPALLEALAQAAGAVLETREARAAAPAPAELVAIEPAAAPPDRARLRAQRSARVQVAEMRLYHADAVKAGRERADLYGSLRQAIDAARESYRREFLGIAGMPDYLHSELLHTLALDDVRLLGEKYPGPLS